MTYVNVNRLRHKTQHADVDLRCITEMSHVASQIHLNSFMTEAVIIQKPDWFLYAKGLRHERVKEG